MAAPEFLFSLVLDVVIFYLFFNGVLRILIWVWSGYGRKGDLINGIVTMAFGAVLVFYGFLPEWMIRVAFGWYALLVGGAMLMQQLIHRTNEVRNSTVSILLMFGYLVLGFLILFTPHIPTWMLMNFFGVYLMFLGFRFLVDAWDGLSSNYGWKRMIHISLPTVFATLLPDMALSRINQAIQHGIDYTADTGIKQEGETPLKAMVHIGPDGLQKVGHFTFSWKGIVYSYGNYDAASGRVFGLLGDGVYFTVPAQRYLENIVRYEKNTIFEYGIQVTPEQEAHIEQTLEQLYNNSYRWYSLIEKEDGYDEASQYEADYPCRLHLRTGAKFYKIKKGKFKTYWVTGDNCVAFADMVLGAVGADVLSIRGIITPGTYYDYLSNEYAKEHSPVVECRIHSLHDYEQGI